MDRFEFLKRVTSRDWSGWRLGSGAEIRRPLHPDGDAAFRSTRALVPSPNSKAQMAHIERSLKIDTNGDGKPDHAFSLGTGSAVPNSLGATVGVLWCQARPTDPVFTIAREDGRKNLHPTVYLTAPYGARVRIGDHMVPQGYPMQAVADRKLHIYDPIDNTVTEVQYVEDQRGNWLLNFLLGFVGKAAGYRCHGVSQYSTLVPSTDQTVRGSTAAAVALAETEIRFSDFQQGWHHMTTAAIPQARHGRWIAPARGSDGPSKDEDAPLMGQFFRPTPEALARLRRTAGPQSAFVLDCWDRHGIEIVDTSANVTWNLEPDERWDQADLAATLGLVRLSDFTLWQYA